MKFWIVVWFSSIDETQQIHEGFYEKQRVPEIAVISLTLWGKFYEDQSLSIEFELFSFTFCIVEFVKMKKNEKYC